MPDDELFALADSNALHDPKILAAQARRMLNDPRSEQLVTGLCNSWLRLDKLGTMPPDNVKFRSYYHYGLEEAMREETQRFVSYLVEHNRPTIEFLNAKYTFLNQDLAKHYGLQDVKGSRYRFVNLPNTSQRGGLLGHASILTLTANGVDTSPVVRGIWILETILGTPPPPPPPDVEPLEPDIRGATTLKQRLAKHRNVATCAECHSRIDPFGFPLEFFDPIGGYRSHYARNRFWRTKTRSAVIVKGNPVDGHAELPSGESFQGLAGLRTYLLTRHDQFVRTFTRALITYATGREVTFRDHEHVSRIASEVVSGKLGVRDVILKTVQSRSFRSR